MLSQQQNARLLNLLLRNKKISREEAEVILREAKMANKPIRELVVQRGVMSEEELARFLARTYNMEYLDLPKYEINEDLVRKIPESFLRKNLVIPLRKKGRRLMVALADPTQSQVIEDLQFLTGADIQPYVAKASDIQATLDKVLGAPSQDFLREAMEAIEEEGVEGEVEVGEVEEEEAGAVDLTAAAAAPVVKLVNGLLAQAIQMGASDIHIEPYEKDFRVRFRMDGVLHEMMHPPYKYKNAVISRIKIISKLDIAERRRPQDGRIRLRYGNREVDIRVSTVPTVYGEKVVMRILDKSALSVNLENLGFEEEALKLFMDAIHKPYGMILVTGPTGSGKSTTLYSAMQILNKPEVNIMTAEDPVEYNFHGLNQVQIREEIGLTFATGLRTIVRQDPDIILVGEIRDMETAEIAIQSALTGHLVFSTLHTNDSASAITRLIDMGVEPFLVSSSVNAILAQRLVRKICPHCRESYQPDTEYLTRVGLSLDKFGDHPLYRGQGCPECLGTGYRGRLGLYELMILSDELKSMILTTSDAGQIKKHALSQDSGMHTLRQDGLDKVLEGLTTLEEVFRVT
ncbi:MAG: type IV-A pilus assembly ATPase PilB [Desulfobulbaceae bacterium]|nr:type IV-A pilus assembly ATPase PilB [Desulfobulbaceae bacterium]